MALKKQIQTAFGIAEYWVVGKIAGYDPDKKIASIVVAGYQNKAAKDNGLAPFMAVTYTIENTEETLQTTPLMELEDIKTLPAYTEETGDLYGKTDEELLELGLFRMLIERVQKNYFDEFQTYFEAGNWKEGGYNFMKTHTKVSKDFEGHEEVAE